MTKKKSKNTLQRHYVSELDHFLNNFDKKPEAYSINRYMEEAKYKKIFDQRDNTTVVESSNILKDF